tara:strand:- start:158 stop:766 length:609 start_codon:yes stop_codon:yes gene_type:complete
MKDTYSVKHISAKEAKPFVIKHHYSHGAMKSPNPCFGLYDNQELIGVMLIATPCSESIRSFIFGKELKDHVKELHRLVLIDDTPSNTESWFISRCFKLCRVVRPDIWGLVSYADSTEGHNGTIYRASNAIYSGMTSKTTFYYDGVRLRHPRQCGINITREEAKLRGWKAVRRESKHRFVFILGGPAEKRKRKALIRPEVYIQ